MSLITRCPACGTMFKVVPDQLRISEGWVRCGHCAELFDAALHLQADSAEMASPQAQAAAAPRAASVPPAAVAAEAASGPESEAFTSSLHSEIDERLLSEGPDSAQLDEEAHALHEHPLDQPFELRRQDLQDPVDSGFDAAVSTQTPLESEPQLHDLSFVRQARRDEAWRRPGIRGAVLLAAVLLGAGLALQVAVHERDRLAAADPGLRPFLTRLCGVANCSVRPLRQIDAIAIEGSSFTKLRPDTYRLNVTLKNQAVTEVAMPALELTLTDAQDLPVVRRVLVAGELAGQPGVIGAGIEWSASVPLALAGDEALTRVAGYRLLAFYP